MQPVKYLFNTLFLLLIAALTPACSSDEPMPGGDTDTDGPGIFLKITLGQPAASRASSNPSGGEDGDGYEAGINHENDIHTLALFIYYDDEGMNVNSDPGTPFIMKAFIDEETLAASKVTSGANPYYATYKIRVKNFDIDTSRPMSVVTVINTTEADDIVNKVYNMGQLTDFIVQKSVDQKKNILDSDWFVMSNARAYEYYNQETGENDKGHGTITIPEVSDLSQIGDKEHPLAAEITVRRLAARIDILAPRNAIYGWIQFGAALCYTVNEAPGNVGEKRKTADVYVTHLLPVNIMQKPSYALKHITEVCGDARSLEEVINLGFLNGYFINIEETVSSSCGPNNYVFDPLSLLKPNATAAQCQEWFGETAVGNLTAASFTPDNRVDKLMPADQWFDCSDAPNSKSVILTYANENCADRTMLRTDILTGLVMRAVYVPVTVYAGGDPLIEGRYSAGQDLWRVMPLKESVTDADCLYFNNEAAAKAYIAANPEKLATINAIPKGQCYYNVWLRHAREDNYTAGPMPMEYAIVRNNIYRISFTFHGPGSQNIIEREPEYINTRIFLRKWNFMRHPEIIM